MTTSCLLSRLTGFMSFEVSLEVQTTDLKVWTNNSSQQVLLNFNSSWIFREAVEPPHAEAVIKGSVHKQRCLKISNFWTNPVPGPAVVVFEVAFFIETTWIFNLTCLWIYRQGYRLAYIHWRCFCLVTWLSHPMLLVIT